MTDFIIIILSVYLLIRGAMDGFIQSILLPFSIILATTISVVYYQLTKDIIVCLLIGLLGPFLLHLLLKLFLKNFATATNTVIKPSPLSRLGGALLSLAWGGVFIVFTLILLASLPTWGDTLKAVHNDITRSASYFFAKPLGERLFAASKENAADSTKTISPSDEKSLAEDPRFQAVLQDSEIQKEIDAHDIVKLMSNPKMLDLTRQIMSDPATMKKVMALYSSKTASQSIFADTGSSQ